MKTNYKVALAALAGISIGIAGARAVQTEAKTPPGYFIAEVEVHDLPTIQKYAAKVPETLAPFNSHYLIRSDKIQALEGEPPKGAIVMIATIRQPMPRSGRCGKARPRAAYLSSKACRRNEPLSGHEGLSFLWHFLLSYAVIKSKGVVS